MFNSKKRMIDTFNRKRVIELETKVILLEKIIEEFEEEKLDRLLEFEGHNILDEISRDVRNRNKLDEMTKRISYLEKELFNSKYPNGKIYISKNQNGVKYMVYLKYNTTHDMLPIGEVEEIYFKECSKKFCSKKLADDKYLVYSTNGAYHFITNTSNNQSIRVDKDMKVIL